MAKAGIVGLVKGLTRALRGHVEAVAPGLTNTAFLTGEMLIVDGGVARQ
jgi:short-subunit dehydrogenase